MPPRWLIGLSSGSTLDGVDAVLLEAEGSGLELRPQVRHTLHQPYPSELRDLLRRTLEGRGELRTTCWLHRLLGETFGQAARAVADQASFSLQKVQAIGCPGHLLWHETEGRWPSLLTLGIAAVVAERTGVTTVSDFMARDVAAGGQGVPITALADYLLFRDAREDRALLHLGGLATVVYVPAAAVPRQVLAFQAGPCTLLLDGLIQQLSGGRTPYDAGGKHAVQGRCLEELLQSWQDHPLWQRRPPRAWPRQLFRLEFLRALLPQNCPPDWSPHDILCTATHFVVQRIVQALQHGLPRWPQRLLLSGGGVRNGLLWQLLEQQLTGVSLERCDVHGVPATARKAAAYAVLAALTLDGVPANLASATGARGMRLLGSLTPGSASNWARCLVWMSQQTTGLAAA